MEKKKRNIIIDHLIILISLAFGLGCIATTHRTAHTLEKGQYSVSAHYLQAKNEQNSYDPIHLAGLDLRFGLHDRFDLGVLHSWDLTKGNEGIYSSLWSDLKVQITNPDNIPGKPVLSSGILKGYIYDSDVKLHVTSIPVYLSYGHSESITSTAFLRYELIRNDYMPDRIFEDPRIHLGGNLEYKINNGGHARWQPKLSVGVGYFNSLTGASDGPSGLTINAGFTIDSPLSR